jgi:NAD-dependent dihydropyrimidine dehydrogenase PreA subunit
MTSRLTSIAWLGWRFVVVQPLRKALRRTPAGARFAQAYFGEGGVPTRVEDREIGLAAAACTGCGLCEPRCRLRSGGEAAGALGLQSVFRLHSKHLADGRAAAALLEACAGCDGCDDACPAGVPIARIVAHLRAVAQANDPARRVGAGP